MRSHSSGERLSWGDTVFLNLERAGMPLNVACISIFEGDIEFADYLQFVESRLPLIPRYLMRVVPSPLNAGLPSWDYDPEFDVRNHVHEVTLKHGTDTELKALAGKIFGQVMDRQRPLWDLTLVRGLKGNRSAVIARMHHCLADGIAGVGIMTVLMDATPTPPLLVKRKLRLRARPACDPVTSLMDGLTSSYSNFTDRILSAWADVLSMTERTLASAGNPASEELSRLLPEITAPTERLCFNVIYRGPQKFACTEIPLSDVKAIRQACGASINDVLLALVASTIRCYAETHGDRVKGRLLRIMVPVNLRGATSTTSTAELGNRISLVPVTIPLDIRNPKKLLAAVHRRTEFLKQAHAPELVGLAGGLVGVLPSAMQAFVGPMISQLPITPFNLVCTNVPGPQFPLYVLGHKMLRWYPYVPIGGELALNCAILSYDGMVYFGFSGDAHAAPDLGQLEKFLKANFVELRAAAGIQFERPKSPRKSTRKPKRPNINQEAIPPHAPSRVTVRIPIPIPEAPSVAKSTAAARTVVKEKPVLLQETA
jgi:diacylglycerol O-acyltransferase